MSNLAASNRMKACPSRTRLNRRARRPARALLYGEFCRKDLRDMERERSSRSRRCGQATCITFVHSSAKAPQQLPAIGTFQQRQTHQFLRVDPSQTALASPSGRDPPAASRKVSTMSPNMCQLSPRSEHLLEQKVPKGDGRQKPKPAINPVEFRPTLTTR